MLAPERTATPIQLGVVDGATVVAGDGATVVEVEGGTIVEVGGATVVGGVGTVVEVEGGTVVEVDGATVVVVVVVESRPWPALSERPQLAVAGIIASNAVPPISNRIELTRIGPPSGPPAVPLPPPLIDREARSLERPRVIAGHSVFERPTSYSSIQMDDDQIVEESPEQVLVRLERHRESLQRRSAANSAPRVATADPIAPAIAMPPSPVAHAARSRIAQPERPALELAGRGTANIVTDELLPMPRPISRDAARHWRRLAQSVLWKELLGVALAMFGVWLVILSSIQLNANVAGGSEIALAALGVIAAMRRVPLALWWTLGIVVGGTLVHFS
jgi:hypothetical protein